MPLSSVQIVAAATEVLAASGYHAVLVPAEWPVDSRLYEDDFGIVALHVYDTWRGLRDQWNTAQGQLVDLMSTRMGRPDPKAWEGYLLLFTTATVPADERRDVTDLRYNTNRLRKLVATGDELDTVDDVRTALLPLLPLDIGSPTSEGSGLLAHVPELLAAEGVEYPASAAVVDAFMRNESIMEALHRLGASP